MEPFKILSEQEVEEIHNASLQVLGEMGVVLTHPATRAMLLEAGAKENGDRLLLPVDLINQCLAGCGGPVTTRGRNGKVVSIGGGELQWHNLGGARDIYDTATGKRRGATVQDIRDTTRLLDALDQATTVTPFFTPLDVPGELMSLAMYRHALPFTTKPLQGPGVQTAQEVKFAVEMAQVIGPVQEVLTMSVSPVSPLTFPDEMVASMVEIARYGIPFGPLPCPTAGTTAPLSLAGALTQQNAEVLASLVIVQSVNPGLPMIYCGRLAMMEPRTGTSIWGGVELGIASAATVQLGHYYHLPVNVYGLSTNSHSLEIQNGYERALNAIIPALAGADELSGIGEMGAGVMGSLAQIVVDNDIAASVRRTLRGIEVSEASQAVEVIRSVMDGPRTFVAEKHTVDYLRNGEIFISKIAERSTFDEWHLAGRAGMAQHAQAKAETILKNHQVPPLEQQQERELERIMQAAEDELVH